MSGEDKSVCLSIRHFDFWDLLPRGLHPETRHFEPTTPNLSSRARLIQASYTKRNQGERTALSASYRISEFRKIPNDSVLSPWFPLVRETSN